MLRSPNDEQKLAIEHSGGVLLSAGAGSGKTFVLVEHIVYLLNELLKKIDKLPSETWEQEIRKYLSSIVMMTFTKKATGEISLRLIKRVELEGKRENLTLKEVEYWKLCLDAIGSLSISTIHGFCLKILKQGYFSDISPEVNVISDIELNNKLDKLFLEWCEKTENKDIGLKEILISNRRSILNALNFIFMNPELRIMWKNLDYNKTIKNDLGEHFLQVIDLLDVSLTQQLDLSGYNDFSDKAWFPVVGSFKKLIKNRHDDLNFYSNMMNFLDSIKRMPSVRKGTGLDEIKSVLEELKNVRKFFKDNSENYENYFLNREGVFKDWSQVFQDLFLFIDERYRKIPGFTFSDLEFYVLNGLRNTPEIVEKIFEDFNYFIVDEFQDTSEVQYEILTRVIKNDFSRIFCVGDVKQAIYGFRGGELSVFRKCSLNIPQNLSMKFNYRSKQNIININNHLFDNIFKKGQSYKGVDKHNVEVEYQEVPFIDDEEKGDIYKIAVDLLKDPPEGKKKAKVSNSEMSYYEALSILEKVKKLLSKENEKICILYKNLAPSALLINLLLESGIDFSAQVKIPLNEDPIISLFMVLVEAQLSSDDIDNKLRRLELIILSYLDLLTSKEKLVLPAIQNFYKNISIIGVFSSFQKFIFDLGVSNSNFTNNMQKIQSYCEISGDNFSELWKNIKNNESFKYSIDFHMGDKSSLVTIMTAHASKGLEFDHVILGGIHTNGRRMPDSSLIGKMPGSFLWKIDSKQKKPFKSPNYIYENLLGKQKDFSESKRLFYVAATRAQKSLSWVDLNNFSEPLVDSSDSWINGLRSFEEDFEDSAKFVLEEISKNIEKISISQKVDEKELSQKLVKTPLLQKDNLGTTFVDLGTSELGVISELSVTRLTSLVDCPRKFYLQNICKIDDEDIDTLGLNFLGEKEQFDYSREDNLLEDSPVRSSAQRGSDIHEIISNAIKHNWTIPLKNNVDELALDSISWAIDELKKIKGVSFISEEAIKFSLFGQMISGTPDLIIQDNKAQDFSVWDFKTGQFSSEKADPYWFQLMIYAYGYAGLMGISQNLTINLNLCFVDEKKNYLKQLSLSDIKEEAFETWKKLAQLDQVNKDHCNKCQFGNLCHPNL